MSTQPIDSKLSPKPYKLDTTRTILDGLIHSPQLFGKNKDEGTNEGLEFLPPVPQSTATLLYEAEAKLKAMSKFSRAKQTSTKKFPQTPQQSKKTETLQRALNLKQKVSLLQKNVAAKANSSVEEITNIDPMKWLRVHDSKTEKAKATNQSPPNKSQTAPGALENPEKMMTIAGYIINIEGQLPSKVVATVSSTISSDNHELNIEVCIREVDPSKIVVEKRYNSILVIGVKQSGILGANPSAAANLGSLDMIELVNIFSPKEVYLTRVAVSPTDSQGRILIKAPLQYSHNNASYMSLY